MAVEAKNADDLKEQVEKDLQSKCDAANAGIPANQVGTRKFYGFTRGKGSVPFLYDKFDESKPDTLPKSIQEFMDVTKVTDQSQLVRYLIAGRNEELYTTASDPIAEFVNPVWPEDVQAQFRLVVRNYARATNSSIEDAVALIKPGIEKSVAASASASQK